MPPRQQSNKKKVKKGVTALKKAGWRTTNEFVIAFYGCSQQAAQSLRLQPNSTYAPASIMAAWAKNAPSVEASKELDLVTTKTAAEIMVKESTKAYHDPELRLSASGLDIPYLTTNFGLNKIQKTYSQLLPCLTLLLTTLLTAENDYERWKGSPKHRKQEMADKILVVIISMLLFFRNCATNAFQLVMGVFLSSSGASRRIIDTFNHMGLSVSYQTIQNALRSLSQDAKIQAQNFVQKSNHLWAVVYDNINFTLRTTSQRLDSATHQINATTLAVFSLPKKFTQEAYAAALSIAEGRKQANLCQNLTLESLQPTEEHHAHALSAFKHAVRSILLTCLPGKMQKRKFTKVLHKHTKKLKPRIR
ncbi:unnamed protein product [Cyclocybe aegerita]|uniref:Uncharacterized protein n=1 Tax=Cyclocybe aegerita TaxID=1973307 RepID=A0A8S0XIV4_CYCAE|nr:unnamed protein product [Cyclocybe aegerita]